MKAQPYVEQCLWCDSIATHWCDYMIGLKRDNGAKVLPPSAEWDPYLCDAPICDDHARGMGHMCGRGVSGCETIDACPQHADGFVADRWQSTAHDESSAERARVEVRAAARRQRMSVVRGNEGG